MAITYTPVVTTNYPIGFPLNSAEWNSRMDELESQISGVTNDIGPRHVIITGVCGEGITAGNVVRIGTSGQIFKADNGSVAGYTGIVGIAIETKLITETVRITTNLLAGTSGLTAGDRYYLGTSGAITNVAPSTVVIVGYALSSTVLILLRDRQDFGDVLTINDATNRVGINNGLPSAALHVTSNASGYSAIIGQNAGAGNTSGLFLHSGASEAHYNWKVSSQDAVSAALSIAPSTAVGGTTWASPILNVMQSGRVAVNTNNPSAAFQVISGVTGYSAIFGRFPGSGVSSGLFLHSEATEAHYNWKISTQDTVGAALTIQASTAAGGTTWATTSFTVTQSGEVATKLWEDITTSLSYVGWASYTTRIVRRMSIGKMQYYQIHILGTSNSTSTTINGFGHNFYAEYGSPMIFAQNSGGIDLAQAQGDGTSLLTFRRYTAAGTWTASGTKEIRGTFWAFAT